MSLNLEPLKEHAKRILGSPSAQIIFQLEQSDEEWFSVEGVAESILVKGSTKSALTRGLQEYIKHVLGGHISWGCGARLEVSDRLPAPPAPIEAKAQFGVRYAYNFCTLSYTSAWWGWDKWEMELDYLALSGVTHALVIAGLESAWFDALEPEGYSRDEILNWLAFPSHQPWQWMSNMESLGRPVSEGLLERRAVLGRQISDRMRELGITPVAPGYFGSVPSGFGARHAGIMTQKQGWWNEQLSRPEMLDPTCAQFAGIADRFYSGQNRIAGPFTAFAADPFHEGGSVEGIDLPLAGKAILDAMNRASSDSVWFLQSWDGNPKMPLLSLTPKRDIMILDLACERVENWRQMKGFEGFPWAWCTINNFGGNSGSLSRPAWTASAPFVARATEGSGDLRGIAAAPEATQNNPLVWELLWQTGWEDRPAKNMSAWAKEFSVRRYGADWPELDDAVAGLLASCYQEKQGTRQMPVNSAAAARPSLADYPKARTWGGTDPLYDLEPMENVWESLLRAPERARVEETWRFDVVDIGLMVLGGWVTKLNQEMIAAYRTRDADRVRSRGEAVLSLISEMDRLAGAHSAFLLGVWLNDARAWGETQGEKDDCEWAARTLITTWHNGRSDLCDYSNRHWSGLIKDVYLTRWQNWISELNRAMADGDEADVKAARDSAMQQSLEWARETQAYPSAAQTDAYTAALEALSLLKTIKDRS